jgi:hypothetical protein
MAEELNVNTEVVNEQTTVEVPENKPKEKKFTQDDLNKLLAERSHELRNKVCGL